MSSQIVDIDLGNRLTPWPRATKNWYECWFDTGAYMNVEAATPEEAGEIALRQARADGHPVESVREIVRLCGAAPFFKHAIFQMTPWPKTPGENKGQT